MKKENIWGDYSSFFKPRVWNCLHLDLINLCQNALYWNDRQPVLLPRSGYFFWFSEAVFLAAWPIRSKCGSRISTDQFPSLQGDQRACTIRKCFGFKLPEVPFPGFLSHSERILARFQRGKYFLFEEYLFMKIWPIFVKRWKPVWIRPWVQALPRSL